MDALQPSSQTGVEDLALHSYVVRTLLLSGQEIGSDPGRNLFLQIYLHALRQCHARMHGSRNSLRMGKAGREDAIGIVQDGKAPPWDVRLTLAATSETGFRYLFIPALSGDGTNPA